MDVREFPLLSVHNINDDDIINSNTIDQMQLEIRASGAAQSENTLSQIIEQVVAYGIRLSMSQEPALSNNSIGSAAIVPFPGGRRVHPIPPPQAELFTHTTVNSKKLATSKFQSRRGGGGNRGQMP